MIAGPLVGRCLCGDVHFEATPPTLWCAHCHCSMCQRAHGAAFVTWVGVAEDRFELPTSDTLAWYRSSELAERGFCRRCGSTLFFRSRRWPGEIHVVRSSFDGAIDREPSGHVYWQSHVDWVKLGDDLPRRPS